MFATLVPELEVSDLKNSLNFYIDILGFSILYRRNKRQFSMLSYNVAQLMLEQGGSWITGTLSRRYGRGVNFQILTKNTGNILALLVKARWPLYEPVEDVWYDVDNLQYGARELLVQDPDEYLLRFLEPLGNRLLTNKKLTKHQ